MLKLSGLLGIVLLLVSVSMNLPERLMLSSWVGISREFSLIAILTVVTAILFILSSSFAKNLALSMSGGVCGWVAVSHLAGSSVGSTQIILLVGALAAGFTLSSAVGFSHAGRLRTWPVVAAVVFFAAGITSLFFNDVMFIPALVAIGFMGLLGHLAPDSFEKGE